ncbi:TPA: hypothetical protein ACH3X1_000047 [Trebouxia sp. C0004]
MAQLALTTHKLEDTSCCALHARFAREAQLVAVVVEAIAGVVVMGIAEGVVVIALGDMLMVDMVAFFQ